MQPRNKKRRTELRDITSKLPVEINSELKDIITKLPPEISSVEIPHHLDHVTLKTAMLVSRAWHGLFSDPLIWKHQIQKDFKISVVLQKDTDQKFYKHIYDHLYRISRTKTPLPRHLWNFNVHPDYQQQLLALISNDGDRVVREIPPDEYDIWLKIALYANYKNVYEKIFELKKRHLLVDKADKQTNSLHNLLRSAVRAGKLDVVTYLLNPENNFNLSANEWILNKAIRSGNLELVKFLSNYYPNLQIDGWMLRAALKSGNIMLVQYLFNLEHQTTYFEIEAMANDIVRSGNVKLIEFIFSPENKFNFTPNKLTLDSAARSGNLELVKIFHEKFTLILDINTLCCAARSGNLELVIYLQTNFKLSPNIDTLNNAARSGNFELVKYLLAQENQFNLISNKDTLDCAARTGDLEIVQYLLKQLNAKPDLLTLRSAVDSENLELVKFLLNPENQFNLMVDHTFLSSIKDPSIYSVIKSDLNANQALCILKSASNAKEKDVAQTENAYAEAHELLIDAHECSPRHFFRVMNYAMLHKIDYPLTDDNLFIILYIIKNLVNERVDHNKYVVIERETIQQILEKTKLKMDDQFAVLIDGILNKLDEFKDTLNRSCEPQF